jgi:hypothetical protein
MDDPKIPITSADVEAARKWLRLWPHAVGLVSLTAVVGLCVLRQEHNMYATITVVICWVVGVLKLLVSAEGAADMVKAWEVGEGEWYMRGGKGDE